MDDVIVDDSTKTFQEVRHGYQQKSSSYKF